MNKKYVKINNNINKQYVKNNNNINKQYVNKIIILLINRQ